MNIGDSYMTYGDVMDYEREIGYEQGMQQGMQQGMEILVMNNIECEISDDKTIKVLQRKYNLDEEQALELITSVKAKM